MSLIYLLFKRHCTYIFLILFITDHIKQQVTSFNVCDKVVQLHVNVEINYK